MGKGAYRKLNPERDITHLMAKPIFYANIPAVGNVVSSLLGFLLSFEGSPGVSEMGVKSGLLHTNVQRHSSSSTSFLSLRGSFMALDARRERLLVNG